MYYLQKRWGGFLGDNGKRAKKKKKRKKKKKKKKKKERKKVFVVGVRKIGF